MNTAVHLERVLSDVSTAGVYHLPHMDKGDVVAAAKANDFATFRVNLAQAGDKEQMLAAIAKAMRFPDWFGHNFDALADCLADMGWQPADGYMILLEHCDGIHGKAEEDFLGALQVFEQAASDWRDEDVPFWCLVEMQADGIAWLPTEP
ncbi:MAG TPA: barstar family protein [Rhodocyclaceae bacterium]|nr:barstar family protein [Rhodocyclaceae bacterium]